jgi:rRNA maturation endonuclease Nob1
MGVLSQVRVALTTADRDEFRSYECKSCGGRFKFQRQVCPDCGGYTLDRIDWSSEISNKD